MGKIFQFRFLGLDGLAKVEAIFICPSRKSPGKSGQLEILHEGLNICFNAFDKLLRPFFVKKQVLLPQNRDSAI